MLLKEILGISALLIALLSYIFYFKNIFLGKTKPHAFSWLIWGILTAIAFFGQVSDNAGPGAWVTGFTTIACFIISFLGFKFGRQNIVLIDWFSLIGAGIALILWYFTKSPLFSVILITVVDAVGFLPTFRKSFMKPQEETLVTYFLNGLKFVLALLALENFSVITALYPASLILTNWLFVAMSLFRRKRFLIEP